MVTKLRNVLAALSGPRTTRARGSDRSARTEPESTASRRLLALARNLCGATDVGVERSSNEDRFHIGEGGGYWIVADGMGGEAAGEVASALAIDAMAAALESADRATAEERLVRAFADAHAAVLAHVQAHPEHAGMGSAAIIGLLEDDVLYTCHAGDTRCYVSSAGETVRLTEDHSVVAALVRAELVSPLDAHDHPAKGRLEQAIGMPGRFAPTVNRRRLAQGDRVLLCSDGLWEPLGDETIESVLSSDGTMRQLASVMLDRAVAAGGPDNITVVLYQHQDAQHEDMHGHRHRSHG